MLILNDSTVKLFCRECDRKGFWEEKYEVVENLARPTINANHYVICLGMHTLFPILNLLVNIWQHVEYFTTFYSKYLKDIVMLRSCIIFADECC